MRLMMIKKSIFYVLIILGILFCVGPAAFSQDEESLLLGEDFQPRQRPGVIFDHDAHNEKAGIEDCSVCHHVYRDGKLVPDESSEDQKCSDCHKQKARDGSTTLIRAYHERCKGCHLKEKKGPITCGECHKRVK
jgi:hypothetical protein